ncbi:MAG: hypothetical protein ACK4FB_11425 [Brevundimonas sp.]|uniref:hypothetical protein n=1 Tax=Brevundimonas sp. TaxID=1871086 RepID=UPI003919A1A1
MSARLRIAVLAGFLAVAACDRPERIEANEAVPAAEPVPAAAPEALTPEGLVQALYMEPAIPTAAPHVRLYFAEALVDGLSGEEGIDFDYRHDAQDGAITGLVVEEVASGPDGSAIVARFNRAGRPISMAYDLCRRENGEWRITDVRSVQNDWNLRDLTGADAGGDASSQAVC